MSCIIQPHISNDNTLGTSRRLSQTDSEIPLYHSYSYANDLVIIKMQGLFYKGVKYLFD